MRLDHTFFSPFHGASQKVAYTATAGETTALPARTTAVWIVTTTDAFVCVGATAVADEDLYLPAYTPVVLLCDGSQKVSAVRVSADGTMYVTPIA